MLTDVQSERVTLYFRQGGSDKVYQATVEPSAGGFVVNFAFSRRGTTMQIGTKTPSPVDHITASRIYEKLIKEKTAKGYTPGEDGTPYQRTDREPRIAAGILPQLLNPVTEADAGTLVVNDDFWMQPKFDGRRILIRKHSNEVVGINRSGLLVGLPESVVEAVKSIAAEQCILDGEAVGDVYHCFDILESAGIDVRPRPYSERFAQVLDLVDPVGSNSIRYAATATDSAQKYAMLEQLRRNRHEGVVFKDWRAPYTSGRPTSGGPQLKLKFVATVSCIVAGTNGSRRSVKMEVIDGDQRVGIGSVTIPPHQQIPRAEEVIEVRYLYAFRGGSLYQPVFLEPRYDIGVDACTIAQLKFKADGDVAEAG